MGTRPRLNILQICHSYHGPFRAICHQYAAALSDHRVTTLYLRGAQRDDVVADTGGDRVMFLDRGHLRGVKISTLLGVARLFRRENFDIVIAHRYKPIYIAGILGRFFPIKILLGVVHEHHVFKKCSRSLFVEYGCRSMNIIAVSDTVKRDIIASVPVLARTHRIFTLNSGIDTNQSELLASREEAREVLGLERNAWCIGTVGRLVTKKRHELLLHACARATLPNTQVVIVGGGPRQMELTQLADRLGLAGKVVFTGDVANAWRYLKAFDVFVLTSGAEEAFGMVLLEAMLARVPIISSDAPGPEEVVGTAAWLFSSGDAGDLADKMEKTRYMRRDEIDAMARAGFERVQRDFSMDAFRNRFRSLPPIDRLIGRPS